MAAVTVVVPAYNAASFINDAIASVYAQTFDDWQIIVVDDGSADNTGRVLGRWDSRLHYVYQRNGGPAQARNTGLRLTTSPYVAFLDADDIWYADKLALQVEAMSTNEDWGLVHTDVMTVDEGLTRSWHVPRARSGGRVFPQLLMGNFIATSTVLARRECLAAVGFFDASRDVEGAEDYDLWLRVAADYPIGYIDKVLIDYRMREAGHNKAFHRSHAALVRVFERNLAAYGQGFGLNMAEVRRKRMAELDASYAYMAWQAGERDVARRHYWASFMANPGNLRPLLGCLRCLL